METLERQVERLDNALTLDHLDTLPKLNKDHFLSSFTREQQRFLQQYLYEGQRVARSWDDSEPMSPPIVNPPAFPKNDPQLGFGTPVLRARLDLDSSQKDYNNGPNKVGRNRTAGRQECSKENERPPVHIEKLPDAVEHNLKSKAESQKNVSKADKKRAKEPNLRSDSDIESAQRRADRRQRKKIKRDIMNPEVPGDSDNEERPSATCKVSKQAKRQSRSRREFALMHGFSSTNVGKNRLTLKPGPRDIGVFQKGKASEKTATRTGKHKRRESGLIFSEAAFLNKPRQNVSKIDLKKVAKISTPTEEDSSVASSVPASTTKARTTSDMVKVRSRKSRDGKVPSKYNLALKMKPQNQDKPQSAYNPADSVVWDIEQAESLGSEVSSGGKQGTIVLKLDNLPMTSNEVLALDTLEARIEPSQQRSLSVTQFDVLSSPSLNPSQSASQICLKTVDVALPSTAPSKYFKPLPPQSASQICLKTVDVSSAPTSPSKYFKPMPPRLAQSHTIFNQLDAEPSAVSDFGELPIEDIIPEIPEPASHFLHSTDPSARSYYDGQEGGAILMPPMQPIYDVEVSAYDGYPDSEFWSPVDHPDDLDVERSDSMDPVNVNFNGQNSSSVVIPADDEMWPSDYVADGELDEMDHTSFIFLSEHLSIEPHSIPQSIWQSDVYGEVSEMCQGLTYQDSEGRLLMTDLESEDQQMQPDDFNVNSEHEVSSMEIYPDVVHHFWQGRSLLYGLSTSVDSSSLHKLSNVEADVARQLQLDHWQPQK